MLTVNFSTMDLCAISSPAQIESIRSNFRSGLEYFDNLSSELKLVNCTNLILETGIHEICSNAHMKISECNENLESLERDLARQSEKYVDEMSSLDRQLNEKNQNLAGLEGELAGQREGVRNQEENVNRKDGELRDAEAHLERKKHERQEKENTAFAVAVPMGILSVLSFGIAAPAGFAVSAATAAAIAVLVSEIDKAKDRVSNAE